MFLTRICSRECVLSHKWQSTVRQVVVRRHHTQPKVLTLDNMNQNVKKMEYAVRGPIVARAQEIENELKRGVKKPFDNVIFCNIGDCHAMGQSPITFLRQVTALLAYPHLLNSQKFPADAKNRARRILDDCLGNSVGSYSQSTGVQVIREDIAKYIEERDGIHSDPEDIFLSTGASESVKCVLQILSNQKTGKDKTGVMIPIPQYPLYSATTDEYDIHQVGYFLDEDSNWGLSVEELQRAYDRAKSHCLPRAIVVINPGNPTGQVLSKQDIQKVIKFARDNHLQILADEVYQHNIYAKGAKFYSFKKVLHDMGEGFADVVELSSFMSASKGYMGECGFRGGYCELVNWDDQVQAMLYKQLSAKLCCSVIGQGLMDVVVNPPRPGEPSYENFIAEKNKVLSDLKFKAKLATKTFNSMPGIKCNEVQGAMYAFPKLDLPEQLIKEAVSQRMAPDAFYCFSLLEEKGVCVVPGSGFGQEPGTHHFRMTILPSVKDLKIVMNRFREFHESFLKIFM